MPFNMAIFNKNAANKIIEQYPNIKHWYICGHSMGGAMASSYVSKNKDKVDGLILLGSYIYGDVSDKDALTIYGSLNTSVKKEKLIIKEISLSSKVEIMQTLVTMVIKKVMLKQLFHVKSNKIKL